MDQSDLTAIHALLSDMTAAWSRGDGAAYASACADDARYVTASGLRIVGRQAIAESHQRIFDTALRGTHLDIDQPVDIQPITANVALIHATGTVRLPSGPSPRTTGTLTVLAVKNDNGWRFASFSNTPVQPDRGR